ncbi:MAG: hypothetical protein V3U58_03615, partial [Thermodesulfobacteriota bacterium]
LRARFFQLQAFETRHTDLIGTERFLMRAHQQQHQQIWVAERLPISDGVGPLTSAICFSFGHQPKLGGGIQALLLLRTKHVTAQMVLTTVQMLVGETGITMAAQEEKRRAVIKQTVCLLIFSVMLVISCTVIAPAGGTDRGNTIGAACQIDDDCQSSFCDLGVCSNPEGQYGVACTPAPLTPEGLRDGKLNSCGAYICSEGRCRSCNSDSQCQSEYGAPKCNSHSTRPGKRCGS